MSMFLCADCDNLRDADDGCEEAPGPGFRLICQACADERQAEREEAEDRLRMISVGGHRDGGSAS
jgi:hypothetical protein